ncbi:MAG: class I SAM-dependent methyltransferase [Bacteroidia bacterium]|nr:class I SAM-dependent methyltransferase [Bacteroidia bacterium]
MTPFDTIATGYDHSFTYSAVGLAQRNQVYDYLESVLSGKKNLKILELNCGTGEDALWLARKGHSVMATDISPEMISLTRHKSLVNGMGKKIQCKQLSLEQVAEGAVHTRFDWVFSNFGGLNCIGPDKLDALTEEIATLLNPGGRFIAVIMPKNCLWESAYFMGKLQFRNAFRRRSKFPVPVKLETEIVQTWYHSPMEVIRMLQPLFEVQGLIPIGMAVPPSYLDPFFRKKPHLLRKLIALDRVLTQRPGLSPFADHYLIDAQLV